MDHTSNYNLSQWAGEDRILREDFNADNAKIEAALSGIPKIATGSYTGKGTYGSGNKNSITFDFEPRVVCISKNALETSGAGTTLIYGQTQNAGASYVHQSNTALQLTVSWSGKSVSWYSASSADRQLNTSNAVYYYFALGV